MTWFFFLFLLFFIHIEKVKKIRNKRRTKMETKELEYVNKALSEAKEFAKAIRQYLYEVEQSRPLTDIEKAFWSKTHDVHVHTVDSSLLIQEEIEKEKK